MSEPFAQYCIVELFGHSKIVGLVTEQALGGETFIRVDVPETKRASAFTRLFGKGAIYSIPPVSEEIARAAADQIYVAPVTVYIEPARQLSRGDDEDDLSNDDE